MFSMDRNRPARVCRQPTEVALTALLHGPMGNSCARNTHARARRADQMPLKRRTSGLTAVWGHGILVLCRPLRSVQARPHLCPIAVFRPSSDSQPRSAAVEPATRPGVLAGRSARWLRRGAGAPLGAT
jgi:hypothetical protein